MSVRRTRQPRGDTGATGATPAFSGCLVTLAADFDVLNSTDTPVLWDTEQIDTGLHDLVTNKERITFPADGIYHIGFHARFEGSAAGTGTRNYTFKKNADGAAVELFVSSFNGVATFDDPWQVYSRPFQAVAGDYISLIVNQSSTETVQIEGGSDSSSMWAYKVG